MPPLYLGPRLIHALGSLCTTTTCRSHIRGGSGLRSHPRASQSEIYARSYIRTSRNFPSTQSGEYRQEEGPGPRRTLALALPTRYLPSVAHLWKSSPIFSMDVTGCPSSSKLA